MRSLIKNKRGSFFELPYLIVLLLVIALLGLLFGYMSWKITGAYDGLQQINDTPLAKSVNSNFNQTIPSIVDTFVFLFFLGAIIALLVAAVRTNFSIVVLGLFFLLFLISIFIASGAANIYQGFAGDTNLQEFSVNLVFTAIVFSKWTPLIMVLIGATILLIMYGKSGGSVPI